MVLSLPPPLPAPLTRSRAATAPLREVDDGDYASGRAVTCSQPRWVREASRANNVPGSRQSPERSQPLPGREGPPPHHPPLIVLHIAQPLDHATAHVRTTQRPPPSRRRRTVRSAQPVSALQWRNGQTQEVRFPRHERASMSVPTARSVRPSATNDPASIALEAGSARSLPRECRESLSGAITQHLGASTTVRTPCHRTGERCSPHGQYQLQRHDRFVYKTLRVLNESCAQGDTPWNPGRPYGRRKGKTMAATTRPSGVHDAPHQVR